MPRSAKKKIVSLTWPEVDKITLVAGWIEKTDPLRFFVNRLHEGILRGRWEFVYANRNEWECTCEGPMYLREEPVFPHEPDPRESDPTRIPDDIALKAREFLTAELKLKPRKPA
jgi:hypothetical protein